MNHMREGGCQCGAIRYSIDKQPKLTFACHCTDCQRRSGSPVVVSLLIPTSSFHITRGNLTPQTRTNDNGRVLKHWFCSECGTQILGMERGTSPDLYQTVRVGTLDNSRGLPPPVHIWTRSAQDWFVFPADAKCFKENPPVPLLQLMD
jgi:hypothetical protein